MAANYWKRAAEQGCVEAQFNLGVSYEFNKEFGINIVEAVKWYRRAAEQGDLVAQYNLGGCYFRGNGVGKDFVEAVHWWRKAAEQGNASAQFNLGVCIQHGNGVEKNLQEAVYWYRKAAEQGDAKAQFNLGASFENGEGVERNLKESERWYREAAEQGHDEASAWLKSLYFNGVRFGVEVAQYESPKRVNNELGELSYWEAEYRPKKVFRRFKNGYVRASWGTKKVYGVTLLYSFDWSASQEACFEEFRQTFLALSRKYRTYRTLPEEDGDFSCTFRDGDYLIVELHYKKEGSRIGRRPTMVIEAWNTVYKNNAINESCARRYDEMSSIEKGGEDAL